MTICKKSKKLYNILLYAITSGNLCKLRKKYYRNRKLRRKIIYLVNNILIDHKNYHDITDIDYTRNHTTPLMIATKEGHLKVVKFLVEKCKAKVNKTGAVSVPDNSYAMNNVSPLFCAAITSKLRVVEYLRKKGANIHTTFNYQYLCSPLMFACYTGDIDVVKYFVEKKVNVNIKNNRGDTCLIMACKKENFHIAKYLLSNANNIDINVKNNKGFSAFYYCCTSQQSEDIDRYDMPTTYEIYRKLEREAIDEKKEDEILNVVKLLIDKNPSIIVNDTVNEMRWYSNFVPHSDNVTRNVRFTNFISCVLCACLMGHYKIVEYIISIDTEYFHFLSSIDKSNIWELLGCTFIDKMQELRIGTLFWKLALDERINRKGENDGENKDNDDMDQDDNKNMEKINKNENCNDIWKMAAYGKLIKDYNNNMTLQDYENIISNQSNIYLNSLIIREKILGPLDEITAYYIKERGRYYFDNKDIYQCIKLWLYNIYLTLNNFTLNYYTFYPKLKNIANASFRFYMCNIVICNYLEIFSFQYILDIFNNLFIKEFDFSQRDEIYHKYFDEYFIEEYITYDSPLVRVHRNMFIALQFIYLLLLKIENDDNKYNNQQQIEELRNLIRKLLVSNSIVKRKFTLLHIACVYSPFSYEDIEVIQDPPIINVVQVILDAGANPNVKDHTGGTPLHSIGRKLKRRQRNIDEKYINTMRTIVNMLIEKGVHFDAKNDYNETFSSYQKSISLNHVENTSLQCLAANELKKNKKLGYEYKNEVETVSHLLDFINLH